MKTRHTVGLAMLAGFGLGAITVQGLHAQAKPPAYVVTEVEIIDETVFKEFSPKVAKTVQESGGKYLSRGGRVIALEGQAPKRFVLSTFDSVEKAQAWRASPGWKALTPLRDKAVKTRAYIAEGVTN